ncbi:MAG: hypothetical protein JKY48_19800 [Flavobacteriales bacterium]|nr:hypothetical protein [Flavobacteriales bacterium]
MKYIIYLFTIATLFSSCACKKTCCKKQDKRVVQVVEEKKVMTDAEREAAIVEQMKNEKPLSPAEDYYKMVEKEIPSDAVARIQRTPCFGKCPVYTLTVFNDGRVEYFGKRNTPRDGRFETKVDEAVLNDIKAKAGEFGFFELNNIYDKQAITDIPSTITSVRNGDEMKTVINRFEGPNNLRSFERYFDGLFEDLDWKPVSQD